MLLSAVLSECVKLRRTFLLHSVWVVPLCVVAILFPVVLTRTALPAGSTAWGIWITWVMTIWNGFFMIFYGALASILLFSPEHGGHAWKHIYAQPTSRWALVLGKKVTMSGLIIATHTALFLLILCSMRVLGIANHVYVAGPAPWVSISLIVGGSCVCALSAAFVCSAASMRVANPALAIGLTILGICVGAFISDTWIASYYPWTMGNAWFKESFRTLPGVGSSSLRAHALWGPASSMVYAGLATVLSCVSQRKRDVI